MILKDHDKIETKSGNTDYEMPPLENVSDGDIEYSIEGEL
jgi:hypothetical protein